MEVDLELEAEFDAQAFNSEEGPGLRAIKVRIDSDRSFMMDGSLPRSASLADDFKQMVSTMLVDNQCSYVLFRTGTWGIFCFVPEGAPSEEKDAYSSGSAKLIALLGGSLRIPNSRMWASQGEAVLDEEIEKAPPISMREVTADPEAAKAIISGTRQGA